MTAEVRHSGFDASHRPGMTFEIPIQKLRKHTPMSANDIVLQKLDQGLLTITMNRPERRNALNPDMTRGLVCLLYTSDAADDLLCVDLGGRRIIKKKKK